jgi:hypothetical protein
MRPFASSIGLFLLCSSGAYGADVVNPDFMGPESCKSCHSEAYNAWKQSKHARAQETLTPEQRKDIRCLSCHAPNLKEQNVAAVSCETCHGGGQYYSPAYVMKDAELARRVGLEDPSERSCRSCHDSSSPSLKAFEFVEKLKLIDHWSAARAARAESARPDSGKPEKKK